jgi:hypothetical protein
VADIEQLNRVCTAISQISDILRVQRQDHRKKTNGKQSTANKATASNVTPLPKIRKSSSSKAKKVE